LKAFAEKMLDVFEAKRSNKKSFFFTFDDDFNITEVLGLKFSLLVENPFQIFFILGTWKKIKRCLENVCFWA